MFRVSIYHWLPLADNMLPDIEGNLIRKENTVVTQTAEGSSDAVEYKANCNLVYRDSVIGQLDIKGKINQRGFTQHVCELEPISGLTLGGIIGLLVPQLRTFTAEILYEIVPISVRNKLAVLHEGIKSFQEFESEKFDPLIDTPAKAFLGRYHVIAILLDSQYQPYREAMRIGLSVSSLLLDVPHSTESCTAISQDELCFLFYSDELTEGEKHLLDSVIYKYFALLNFMRFVAYVIVILKDVRDHVIPLRRELVIKLQRNTEEHFVWLTRLKKYLSYVNIKLPVIQKVWNHLNAAYKSDQFTAKVATFNDPAKISRYVAIRQIRLSKIQPLNIISKITEDYGRLQALYDEDIKEIDVISEELSEVLEGSLLAQNVQILTRELDATRVSLELDRGGKNRANALKVLSVLASANIGALVANLFNFSQSITFLITVATGLFAFIFTELYIGSNASYFRLVVPLNITVPRESLAALTSRRLKRTETNGTRRINTWAEKYYINTFYKPKRGNKRKFDVTIDYEMRGYIYSITLETESRRTEFDTLHLMIQLVHQMDEAGCKILEPFSRRPIEDSSLLAGVLEHLDISLNSNLKALNKILTTPSYELQTALEEYTSNVHFASSLSEQDSEFLDEIVERSDEYLGWLLALRTKADTNQSRLLRLLGETNIQHKYEVIRQIKPR
jgi:hypothetical protein